MIEFTKQWAVNIVALVLFIVLFELLLPTGKMKKYVNLVTGTILIIAIITPLLGLFGRGQELSDFQITESNSLGRLQVEKDKNLLKEEQLKQIVEVYRLNIVDQLEQKALEVDGVRGAKADVIINEDSDSDRFGEILRAYIEVRMDENGGGSGSTDESGGRTVEVVKNSVREVKKVTIDTESDQQKETEKCDPVIQKKLEEKISALYGISKDNIVISRRKR